LTEFTAVCR